MPGRSNPDSPAAKTIEKPYRLFLAIGFAASAILMIAAIRGDLWLDEVMSLKTALTAPGWLALITQNANDNNHLLNTFFLRLLGWQQHLFVYRLPAVLFGIYTIVALAWTARRWSCGMGRLSGGIVLSGYFIFLGSQRLRSGNVLCGGFI